MLRNILNSGIIYSFMCRLLFEVTGLDLFGMRMDLAVGLAWIVTRI